MPTSQRRMVGDGEQLVETYPELFRIDRRRGWSPALVPLTEERPRLRDLRDELWSDGGSASGVAQLELVAAVMAKGDVYSYYGNHAAFDSPDVLHVIACGINWVKFAGVTSERWTNFDGTENPGSDEDVLEAEVECSCRQEIGVKFGLEPPSLTRLFLHLSQEQLDKILEDE